MGNDRRGGSPAARGDYQQLRETREQLRASRAQLAATLKQARSITARLQLTREAGRAAVAQTHLRRYNEELEADATIARLQARLATMPVIEQAKGIVIGATGCTPEAAFDWLRRVSQRENMPVRDIAARLVEGAIGHHASRYQAAGTTADEHDGYPVPDVTDHPRARFPGAGNPAWRPIPRR
jgi:cell division septum initiation protein DivIVA